MNLIFAAQDEMDKEKTRGTEYLIDIDDIEAFGQIWSQYTYGPLMPVYVMSGVVIYSVSTIFIYLLCILSLNCSVPSFLTS